ncbi:homeobox domain-containing protein [Diaporthe amygdali]|uniref:homeobox domain-containing protein n=1 Tax=Phomopsis amygdali TaxID=1214568 RepID=UPI0022FEAD7B|nr:homeobox domain-containing protein [Diaporthe amygdali]KAJ0121547.1 homeobox domain-containing protein [Diaporthe amygdali]
MSSQPTSPAPLPGSSQQQNESTGNASSSPHSTADSAVHIDETQDKVDADSSFQSNSSERHPKGKRKRTAAKDKAILEAAYNANPKPDKAARLDIVKRVSLNEKEVQIWFQNRRQNDRRKSRPLSPQEIAALQYGGMQVLSSDPVSYGSQPHMSTLPNPNTSPYQQSSLPEGTDASSRPIAEHAQPETTTESQVELPEAHHNRRESAASMGAAVLPSSQPVEFMAGQPHHLHRSASVGYFANRLHAGTSYQANRQSPDSLRHEFLSASRPSSSAPVLPPPLSSGFRLSMSMEGKAELVPQPSPPRLSPSALSDGSPDPFDRPNLHRSRSAAACITLPPISTLTASLDTNRSSPIIQAHVSHQPQPRLPQSLHRSRSRDVHAWEAACEANIEPRDELTAYAARESSGSAIAAISLLRTLSSSSLSSIGHNGNVLQSNSAKRNARQNPHPNPSAKKPKLSRASSSVGRLQTNFVNTTTDKPPVRREQTPVEVDDLKKGKVSILFSPGGNDSDKENWSPDKEGYAMFRGASRPANGRRPLPSEPTSKGALQKPRRSVGRVLGDAGNRTLLGRARTAPTSRRKKGSTPVSIFEDGAGEADVSEAEEDQSRGDREDVDDEEVERFMRGEVSPSKKGAASAIAGLLALSQGNWR